MKGKPKKSPREKDLTSRYLSGGLDEDRVEQEERFSARNKGAEQERIERTANLRSEEQSGVDIGNLPLGEVTQVYSRYSEVVSDDKLFLCVIRKTLSRVSDTIMVVGDQVHFRDTSSRDESGKLVGNLEGVIEKVLPRRTVLTRADSFKGMTQHPIVANAEQMLIVASIVQPRVKWGLVDRMIVAALGGGLRPIICLNKIDLADQVKPSPDVDGEPQTYTQVLAHYQLLDVQILQTSVIADIGLEELKTVLGGKTTVLAGHSGVGKSSLIRAVQPQLDLRVGEVSQFTEKGRHTTTSARRYLLDFGGVVVDTPGVKLFGLWGVTRDNLTDFFPDMGNGTAPQWRQLSFERISESLAG